MEFNNQLMKELKAQQSELGKLAKQDFPTVSSEDIKNADRSPLNKDEFGDYINPETQKSDKWWEHDPKEINEDILNYEIGNVDKINNIESKNSSSNIENEAQLPVENMSDPERTPLTDQDRTALKERTGWSDKIVDAIRTKEEAEIYEKAGLVESEVNGKPALIQPEIKGDAYNSRKDPEWSNKDLAGEGYAPYDESGRPYELHHIGQDPDSPLAELTHEQHHKNGNFQKLHSFDESKIDREDFRNERKEYWMDRYNSL